MGQTVSLRKKLVRRGTNKKSVIRHAWPSQWFGSPSARQAAASLGDCFQCRQELQQLIYLNALLLVAQKHARQARPNTPDSLLSYRLMNLARQLERKSLSWQQAVCKLRRMCCSLPRAMPGAPTLRGGTNIFSAAWVSAALGASTGVAVGLAEIRPRSQIAFSDYSGYGFVDEDAAVKMALESARPAVLAKPSKSSRLANYLKGSVEAAETSRQKADASRGQDIIVAVIDTGIDSKHADLKHRMWVNADEVADHQDNDNNSYVDDHMGFNFVGMNNIIDDMDGHGTHVAGRIVAHNPSKGMFGVAYEAKIMAIKALKTDGDFVKERDSHVVADAIRYAVDNKAKIINLSLRSVYKNMEVSKALEYAAERGVIVFAAAGNDGYDWPGFPASHPLAVAVGNGVSPHVGSLDYSSNRAGPERVSYDPDAASLPRRDYFTAPGRYIYSTVPNNSYDYMTGTSMAAPYVAGIAARMLSANPELTRDNLLDILANTATALPPRQARKIPALADWELDASTAAQENEWLLAAFATMLFLIASTTLSKIVYPNSYGFAPPSKPSKPSKPSEDADLE